MHAVSVGRGRAVAVLMVVAVAAGLLMVAAGSGVAQDGDSPPPELVVLTRSDIAVDALGAGPVAGILGAPVLVTIGSRLLPVTAEAVEAIDPDLVVLAGGEAALSLLAGLLAEYQVGRPVVTGVSVTDEVIPGLNAELVQGLGPEDLQGQLHVWVVSRAVDEVSKLRP